ncbi:MAG: class I SAM-dependent methyltransferase [Leptolyngbyaceae cyanobacterium bins.349]|nr:class I SAM-dependent methyltransferase [Leptolyngbyaceae cyanobacterium bins.349]
MTPTAHPPFERDWTAYYNAIAGRPPRETMLKALAQFEAELPPEIPKFAVDLGCGDGRDTAELLRREWQVLAIDGEEAAIARLLNRPDIDLLNLQTRIERFEDLTLPRSLDLINASFCLPFCPPAAFARLWQTITNALRPGGRFSGQLIGDRDSWAVYPNTTYHTRQQVEQLLAPFEVEWLQEEEHPGKTAIGEDKYWHLFHVVARKL